MRCDVMWCDVQIAAPFMQALARFGSAYLPKLAPIKLDEGYEAPPHPTPLHFTRHIHHSLIYVVLR
jgi:hypothetical protein